MACLGQDWRLSSVGAAEDGKDGHDGGQAWDLV